MSKPSDYKHIDAWGRMMGSLEYYRIQEQERAALEEAPITACYHRQEGGWACFEDLAPAARDRLMGGGYLRP